MGVQRRPDDEVPLAREDRATRGRAPPVLHSHDAMRVLYSAMLVISCGSTRGPEPGSPVRAAEPANAREAPIVVREGGCTITVGAITSFEVSRGAYRLEERTAHLPADQREQARSEDHFEAHGRCVLDVQVGSVRRSYLHVVQGFMVQGPDPSREQCVDDRADVARHLMTMTEHCANPDAVDAK